MARPQFSQIPNCPSSWRRNADEALIDEIAQYGPVVALGRPGEKHVPFGAQRHYEAHETWQEWRDAGIFPEREHPAGGGLEGPRVLAAPARDFLQLAEPLRIAEHAYNPAD